MDQDTHSISSSSSEGVHETSSNVHRVILHAGHNTCEWLFIFLSIPNMLVLLGLSVATVYVCEVASVSHPVLRLEVLAAILAGIAVICSMYGTFQEHQYDMYLHTVMAVLALLCSWVSSGIIYEYGGKWFLPKVACNSVITLLCVISFLSSWKATHALDWVEFRIIGVSDSLSAMYKQLSYFLTLLRLDAVCVVLFSFFSMNVIFRFVAIRLGWLYYQISIFIFSLLTWICGKSAVSVESTALACSFCGINVVYIAFIICQGVSLFYPYFGHPGYKYNEKVDKLLQYSVLVLGLFCIILKSHLIAQMKKTCQTFGRGLNTRSFRELVSGDSSNLLAHPRSDILF